MKKIFYLLTVVLTLVSASCSNEDVVNNDNNLITELNISIEGGAESRMGVTYDATNGFKFDWVQGDQVYVIKAEANDYSYAIFTYSPEKGKFVTGYETPLVAGEKYYAFYGQAQAINSFNVSVVKANMMLGNGGTEMDNLPMLSDVFTATSEGTFATLHHLCGIVEIPVIGSGDIYKVGFNAVGSHGILAGNFNVTFGDDGKVETATINKEGTEKSAVASEYVEKTNPLTLSSTPKSIFVAVLPGTYSSLEFDYHLVANSQYNYKRMDGTLTVQRGKIHKKTTPVEINVEQ